MITLCSIFNRIKTEKMGIIDKFLPFFIATSYKAKNVNAIHYARVLWKKT